MKPLPWTCRGLIDDLAAAGGKFLFFRTEEPGEAGGVRPEQGPDYRLRFAKRPPGRLRRRGGKTHGCRSAQSLAETVFVDRLEAGGRPLDSRRAPDCRRRHGGELAGPLFVACADAGNASIFVIEPATRQLLEHKVGLPRSGARQMNPPSYINASADGSVFCIATTFSPVFPRCSWLHRTMVKSSILLCVP